MYYYKVMQIIKMKKSLQLVCMICFLYLCLQSCLADETLTPVDSSTVYMAVFGDVQYLTMNKTDVEVYKKSVDWILRKKTEGYHFNCILYTGDITMTNLPYQWQLFQNSTSLLAHEIPIITMTGDHDYTWVDGGHIEDRSSTHINEYLQQTSTTPKIVAWYEEGHLENIVVENTIHGQRLDLLVLEFGPREEVVAWADAYVKAHPDHHFILMNHEYLEKNGRIRTDHLKCERRLRNTSYLTPEQLWNKLIKCNDNIRCVLCGHVGSLYALTHGKNDFDREIPQIEHNIQAEPYRFDNWLMMWEFPADSDSANVYIYNTQTEQYFEDKRILFKFKYKDNVSRSAILDRTDSSNSTSHIYYNISGVCSTKPSEGITLLYKNGQIIKSIK